MQKIAILLVLAAGLTAPASAQTARLTGTVFDHMRNIPLAGAEVFLVGTEYNAVTNQDGRFFIPDLPAGLYAVSFRHAQLDLLDVIPDAVTVRMEADGTTDVQLGIPAEPRQRVVPSRPAPARTTGGAALVGVVVEAGSVRPVAGANVSISGSAIRSTTDARGRFVLFGVAPGPQMLQVEMLGYASRAEIVTVTPNRTAEVTVQLSTRPVELAPLEVSVRSDRLDRAGYYDRRDDPGLSGFYIEREDIEKRNMIAFQEVFQTIPAIFFQYVEPGVRQIRFRRAIGSGGEFCVPAIFIDGARFANPVGSMSDRSQRSDLDAVPLMAVSAIEIYVGATAPIQYGNGCGAILIWTR